MTEQGPTGRSERLPRRALLSIVVLSIVIVAVGRLTGVGLQEPENPMLVETRSLVFSDAQEGSIAVIDATTGQSVSLFSSGEGNFIRTALRALAYSRRLDGIGPEEPFTLGRAADGRLVLYDPATDKRISLDAFGDDNRDEFAALLNPERGLP